MAKSITPKAPSRTESRRLAKADMSAEMVAVAALTGKKEDKDAARPAALATVRKCLMGHLSQNQDRLIEAITVFRAVTGTEATEYDAAVTSLMAGAGAARMVSIGLFLADPIKCVEIRMLEVLALMEQIPAGFRAGANDPVKYRAKLDKFMMKDHTKTREACSRLRAEFGPEFERAGAALMAKAEQVAPEQVAPEQVAPEQAATPEAATTGKKAKKKKAPEVTAPEAA